MTFHAGHALATLSSPLLLHHILSVVVYETRSVNAYLLALSIFYVRLKSFSDDYIELDSKNIWKFVSLCVLSGGSWIFFWQVFAAKYGGDYYLGDQPLPTCAQCAWQIAWWMGSYLVLAFVGNALACHARGASWRLGHGGVSGGAAADAAAVAPTSWSREGATKKTKCA